MHFDTIFVASLIAQNNGISCGPLTWYKVEIACGLSAQKSDIRSIRLGHLEQVVTQLLLIGHDSPLPRVRVPEAPDPSMLEVLEGSPLPNGTRGRPAIPTATFHPVLTDSKKRSRPIAPVASPSRSLVQALSEELEANDSVQDPPLRFPRRQSAKRQRTSTMSVQDRSISPNPDAESSIEKHPSDNPSLPSRLDLFNRIDQRIVQHMTAVRSLRDCRKRKRLVRSCKNIHCLVSKRIASCGCDHLTVQSSQQCRVIMALRSPCILIAQYVSFSKDGQACENFCLTCRSMPCSHFANNN